MVKAKDALRVAVYRPTWSKPSLGYLLASNNQLPPVRPALNTGVVLDSLAEWQRTYVDPLVDLACRAVEQYVAGTPLASASHIVAEKVSEFQRDQVDPLIDYACDSSAKLVHTLLLPLLPVSVRTVSLENLPLIGDSRRKHIRLLFGTEGEFHTRTPEEQALRRQLAVATATFGLTSVTALFCPPLMVLSLPGLLYLTGQFIVAGVRQIINERRIGFMTYASVTVAATMALSQYWPLLLWMIIFVPTNILILKTRQRSRQNLVNLLGETPRFVWVLYDNTEMQIPFEQLRVGDIVVVGAGEVIPVDGTILTGIANIDQHMLTGEAQPVEKGSGDTVFATTILLAGRLHIQVEQAGTTTLAAQIGAMLSRTADHQTSMELQSHQLAEVTALPLLLLSAATLLFMNPVSALAAIYCSIGAHARLTMPIGVMNFLHLAAEQGILVKDGGALELLAKVDTVVFDKTGTLTQEQPHVGGLHICSNYSAQEVLRLAAATEVRQNHPIARAILHEAQRQALALPAIDEAAYQPGYGLQVGLLDGRIVRVGSLRFMQAAQIEVPTAIQAVQAACFEEGHSLVYVAVSDQLVGAIELHTTIRPEAAQVVKALHQRGLHIVIISGDQPQPTYSLARQLGIDQAFAEVLPHEKASLVAQLQQAGRTVCFVGDGINDSLALKQAQVSVSLRGATTIAMDTAQVVLMDQSLHQLPLLFELAQQLNNTMQRSLLAAIIPAIGNMACVYVFQSGLIVATILSTIGLSSGVVNAMLPLLHHKLQPLPALPASQHQSACSETLVVYHAKEI